MLVYHFMLCRGNVHFKTSGASVLTLSMTTVVTTAAATGITYADKDADKAVPLTSLPRTLTSRLLHLLLNETERGTVCSERMHA